MHLPKQLFLILALVTPVAGPTRVQAEPANWREAVAPFQIMGPLHYVGTRGLGVFLVATNDGLVLLGGAMPGSAGAVLEAIRALGFKPDDVRLILNAHAHVDHAGTHAALVKATGAKLVAMEQETKLLLTGGRTDYLFGDDATMRFDGVGVDRIVKDGETVTQGGVGFTAHATPGHTRGCTTWETRVTVDGKTHVVVFADGLSVNPGTRLGADPSYPGIADDYRRTFRVLQALKPDVFLAYHAEFFDLEAKRARQAKEGAAVWIDPDGFRRAVERKLDAFSKALKN